MNKVHYNKNKNNISGWRRSFLWLRRKSLTLIMIVITALVLIPCAADAEVPVVESDYTFNANDNDERPDITLSKPSGLAVGDLCLVFVSSDSDEGPEWNVKTGWTRIVNVGSNGPNAVTGIYWRIADGTEGSTETFTQVHADDLMGWWIRISGVDTNDPIHNISGVGEDSGNSHDILGHDTTKDDVLALWFLSFDGADFADGGGSVTGSGWTDFIHGGTAGESSYCIGGGWGRKNMASQGSTGTVTVDGDHDDGASYAQVSINPSAGVTTTIGDGTSPADKDVAPDSTNNAVDAFTLVTNTEPETVTALEVTFSGTAVADVASSGVKIYDDSTGGTPNEWDAGDTLKGTASFSGTTADVTVSISVDDSATQYLVTYDIATGATLTNTLQGAITAATADNTLVYNDTTNATLTISVPATTTIGDGASPASKNVTAGSTRNAVDAFTLVTDTGTDTVTELEVTFSGTAVADVASSGVKIYDDSTGGTANEWDAADTLKGTASFSGSTASVTVSISVDDSATQYLVTYNIALGATVTNTLQGAITDATVTNTLVNNDATDATLTICECDTTPTVYDAATSTTYDVPAGCDQLTIKAWGAGGGGGGGGGTGMTGGASGGGGFAQGTISVTSEETLTIRVGGGGGGGLGLGDDPQGYEGEGGGGGGYTGVLRSSTELIIASGGGGGGGADNTETPGAAGGAGGGTTGTDGADYSTITGGGGGTPSAGGAKGVGTATQNDGTAGSSLLGGEGGDGNNSPSTGGTAGTNGGGIGGGASYSELRPGGGGGGGGHFGGGGGGGVGDISLAAAGGGGGSSYTTGTSTINTSGSGASVGNNTEADTYAAGAGTGGSGGTGKNIAGAGGNDGLLVITPGNCTFSYRKEITIQASQVIGSADHLNFPMLVSLSGDWLKTTAVDSNGRIESDYGHDIIFRDTNLAQLDHEIEDYDGSVSGGTLVAWVRIPTLDYDDDMVIYMYYGNSCIESPTENAPGVWDSNYKGVWHLGEEYALDFDIGDDCVDVGNLQSLAGSSELTMSVWFFARTLPGPSGDNDGVFIQHDDWDEQMGIRFDQNNSALNAYVETGGVSAGVEIDYSGNIIINTWYHAVLTFNNGVVEFFLDGVSKDTDDASSSFTTIPDLTNNMFIASLDQGSGDYFDGTIDEARIWTRALSPTEISDLYEGSPVSRTGLVGEWLMNEGTGNTVSDSSGEGNDGDMTGHAATWIPAAKDSTLNANLGASQNMDSSNQVAGRIDGSLNFNGSNNYISVAANASLDVSTNFTVSGWFYKNTSGGENLIYSSGTTNTQYWTIRSETADKIEFNVDGTGGWASSTAIGTGAWHHMAVVKAGDSGTNMSFYVDGQPNGTATVGAVPDGSGQIKTIGYRPEGNDFYWAGKLDEIRISNMARDPDWIETEHYNQKENSIFYIEGDEDDLGDCSYSFYKPITIDFNEVFGTSDHTDFPFLVNISSDNDLRTIANNGDIENTDGYDIIFRDSYGRQLDHEIEDYEPTTGEFVAWVRIPTLSLSVDTVIYMYYGNSCISASQENVTGVWNSNYKGVWHLADTTTSGHELDSTSNDNHGLNGWNAEAEDFDDITDWLTNTSAGVYTVEENPSGQVHLLAGDGSGTDSSADVYKINMAYEGDSTYTIECRVKFDVLNDFTTNDDGVLIGGGNYLAGNDNLWGFTFFADRIHDFANDALLVSRTINTGQWYVYRFVVTDDDDVAIYEDGTHVITANDIGVDGGYDASYLVLSSRNFSTSPATTEAHFDWVRASTEISGFGATRIDGRIDGSLDFDGSGNYIEVGTTGGSASAGTVEAWINASELPPGDTFCDYIIGHTTQPSYANRIQLYLDEDSTLLGLGLGDNHKTHEDIQALSIGTWYHVVFTWDGTNYEVFVDGGSKASGTYSGLSSINTIADIGNNGEPTARDESWNGIIDEFRISDTPRSAGWIKTCYYNQKAGSTFYSIDPEEEYAPTAVDLISFTATGQDESVLVEWETAQEIDNLGFNLYRSSDPYGSYAKLNSGLIPGLISSVSGQQYTYIDTGVTRDVLYYYMLEDVDLSGTRTMHGPICVDWDGDGIPDGDVEDSDDDDSDEDTDDGPEVKIPELRFEEVDFGPEGWTPSSSYASWVKLSSFRASQGDEGIALEWETSFEVDNFGFHVYRELDGKFYRITPDMVPGSVFKVGTGRELPAGQSYMYWDGLSEGTGGELYWLDCVDLNGGRASFGPIKPEIYGQPVSQRLKVRFKSITRHQVSRARALGKARELREELSTKPVQTQSSSATFRTIDPEKPSEPRLPPTEEQWVLAAQPGVKIYISEDGWYRVGKPELVAAGLSPAVDPRYLQLYADGEEKSMMVTGSDDGRFDPLDAIEFYGTGLDTPFTAAHVYWLVVGSRPGWRVDTPFIDIRLDLGQRMRIPRGLRGRGAPLSFPFPMELKERTFYFAALKNGERENFFGSVISTEPVDQLLTVAHPDLSSPEDAVLEVVLQGATDSIHQVKILFNYVEVGELGFSRQERRAFEIQVPYDLLLEGDNIVTLIAQGGATDVSLVDKIRLTYWRTYTADEDFLQFKTSGGEWLSIGGFSSSGIQVVDITDPMRMINIRGKVMTQDSGYAITVKVPGAGERTLLAFTEETIKQPAGIEANLASSWHELSQGAEVIIIGHSDLLESVGFLKQLREQQGWSVVLVDVEDLYDEFNFGAKSPWAVKDFLARAYDYWNSEARFVLLVGDASYDPRNYLGFGEFDLVPTKFVDTGRLTTASDDWFVDFDDDGLPEMAVGRLPVESAEEAATVVSKIIAFEGVAGEGVAGLMSEALLVADINDSIDFEGASADVADELLMGSFEVREILRGRSATARTDLLNLLNQGQLLVNYVGHGSTKTWNGNLLTSSDAWNLTNSPYLPFLVSMTCLNGFFQDPYSESLAEAFLKAERGGAVAVWTSSGLTLPTEQAVMNLELIRQLSNGQGLTIGEAVMRAKRAVTNGDIRRTWILFGDPTLRLR